MLGCVDRDGVVGGRGANLSLSADHRDDKVVEDQMSISCPTRSQYRHLILYYFVITMVGGKTQIRSSTTYDAIAIYTSEHPCEYWIIVLPSNSLFEGRVLC